MKLGAFNRLALLQSDVAHSTCECDRLAQAFIYHARHMSVSCNCAVLHARPHGSDMRYISRYLQASHYIYICVRMSNLMYRCEHVGHTLGRAPMYMDGTSAKNAKQQ